MSTFHDEVEIDDMNYDKGPNNFTYPCPCGGRFEINMDKLYFTLANSEAPGGKLPPDEKSTTAICPSCSLQILCIGSLEDVVDAVRYT